MIYDFYHKKGKLMNTTSLCEKVCCPHKELKTSIRTRSETKKSSKAIVFYQEACVKPYIEMNTELRKNTKKRF